MGDREWEKAPSNSFFFFFLKSFYYHFANLSLVMEKAPSLLIFFEIFVFFFTVPVNETFTFINEKWEKQEANLIAKFEDPA